MLITRKKSSRLLCLLLTLIMSAGVMMITACSGDSNPEPSDEPIQTTENAPSEEVKPDSKSNENNQNTEPSFENLSAHELVARMGAGWNLGNTFDAAGSGTGKNLTGSIASIETNWLPSEEYVTTQTLIKKVRELGFNTIRIPTTWRKVADPDNNWQIREDWLDRIQEVVDWAMEEDMFVILNTHHENAELKMQVEGADLDTHAGRVFLTSIWQQIAERFKDYDERLIFAGLNEPRHEGGDNEWGGGSETVRTNLNYLNQAFVDTVRATGGNNVYRILQVPTVAAGSAGPAMADFVVPKDPLNSVNKIAWSIHTYAPFAWAHDGHGEYTGPGSVMSALNSVQKRAAELGIPVIMGEWGANHNVASDISQEAQDLRDIQRAEHAEDYLREARARGMAASYWDNAGFNENDELTMEGHRFGIIPRVYPHEPNAVHLEIIKGIMRGTEGCRHDVNPDDCTDCLNCDLELFRFCTNEAPCPAHTLSEDVAGHVKIIGQRTGWGGGINTFDEPDESGGATRNVVVIDGDGTYTAWFEFTAPLPDSGNTIEFMDMKFDIKGETDEENDGIAIDYPNFKVIIVSLVVDGVEVAGDIENCKMVTYDDGYLRYCVLNPWNPNLYFERDNEALHGASRFEITFTVSGLS